MIERPQQGMKVKIARLGDTHNMIVHPRHLAARQAGAIGTIIGWVPGHGGDVWWVRHGSDTRIGAYSTDEMEERHNP